MYGDVVVPLVSEYKYLGVLLKNSIQQKKIKIGNAEKKGRQCFLDQSPLRIAMGPLSPD